MGRVVQWFRGHNSGQRLEGYDLRPDLLAAASQMVTDARSDAFVIELEGLLSDTETVLRVLEGRHLGEMGLLALTSGRVFFRSNKVVGRPDFDVSLSAIVHTEAASERSVGSVQIRTMDAIFTVDQILGNQGDALVAAVLAATGGQPTPGRDPIEVLAELRALRDCGAITADEFEIRKAALWHEL